MDPRVEPEDDKPSSFLLSLPSFLRRQESTCNTDVMDPRVKPEDDGKISWIPGSSPRMTEKLSWLPFHVIPAKMKSVKQT